MQKVSEFISLNDNKIPQYYQMTYVVMFYKQNEKYELYNKKVCVKNINFCKLNNINYVIRRNNSEDIINSLIQKYDIVIYIDFNKPISNYIDVLTFIVSNLEFNKINLYKNEKLYLYFIKSIYSTEPIQKKYSELNLEDDTINTLNISNVDMLIKNIRLNKYILSTDDLYPCGQRILTHSNEGSIFKLEAISNNEFIIKCKDEYLHSHYIEIGNEYEATLTTIYDDSSIWNINKMAIRNKHTCTYLNLNVDLNKITTTLNIINEWMFIAL